MRILNHGSVSTLVIEHEAEREWLEENVYFESQNLTQIGIVGDTREMYSILDGFYAE